MQANPRKNLDHYPGGKGRSFRNILNLFPPHSTYVETHLGSGAVLRRKRPALRNVGIEKDPKIHARWIEKNASAIELVCGDAVDWLLANPLEASALVYSDPPYLPSTRRTARYYRHDHDEFDHVRLLTCLRDLKCMVVVSGYRSSLYDAELRSWTRTDYVATTHNGNVPESAWTNFEPGSRLHDYTWLGSDFRERERIRRKRRRILRNLLDLPPAELNAVIAELRTAKSDLPGSTVAPPPEPNSIEIAAREVD